MASRAKKTRRQARFEIIVGLCVFLASQGAAAYFVESWFPSWRETRLSSRVEHFRARAGADQPGLRSVLFLGSSRFLHGVHVNVIERQLSEALGAPVAAFNYGTTGGNANASLRHWKRLRTTGIRPTLAVVEVVPSHLHEQTSREDLSLAFAPAGELDWTDIQQMRDLGSARADLYWENLLARAFPTYGHRLTITGRLAPTLQPGKYRRQADSFADASEDIPRAKFEAALRQAHEEHGTAIGNFRMGKEHAADVENLLAQLRADGVPTVLVVMPEGPMFRSWYREGAWTELESFLHELAARQGAVFVSTRDWFGEEAFFDSHHMVVAGGRQFSTRFSAEVLAPRLRKKD